MQEIYRRQREREGAENAGDIQKTAGAERGQRMQEIYRRHREREGAENAGDIYVSKCSLYMFLH